jgi:hypothetical protein
MAAVVRGTRHILTSYGHISILVNSVKNVYLFLTNLYAENSWFFNIDLKIACSEDILQAYQLLMTIDCILSLETDVYYSFSRDWFAPILRAILWK